MKERHEELLDSRIGFVNCPISILPAKPCGNTGNAAVNMNANEQQLLEIHPEKHSFPSQLKEIHFGVNIPSFI